MATTTTNPLSTISKTGSQFTGIFGFFKAYWLPILLGIFVIVFIVLFIMQRKQNALEREERDSEAYAMFNTVMSDCVLNANKKWINKKYRLINLLWLGLPFLWKEHSAKLKNIEGALLGYYRGHFESQDGCMNYLVYKTSTFGFMENKFILRFPKTIDIESEDPKTKKTINKTLRLMDFVKKDKWNDDITLQCQSVQKISIYYHTPNFVYNDLMDVMDLRQYLHKSIMEDTWKLAYERNINNNTKIVRKTVEGNPFVQAKKQGGEIEQENQEIEHEEEYKK